MQPTTGVLPAPWRPAQSPCLLHLNTYATRSCSPAFQDTTNNPLWTGQKEGLSLEDARIARLMKKYEGYIHLDEAAEQGQQQQQQQQGAEAKK